MAKFKLTNKVVDDITQIWNYTFDKWSESQVPFQAKNSIFLLLFIIIFYTLI